MEKDDAVRLKVRARNTNSNREMRVLEFPTAQHKWLLVIQEALVCTGARIKYTDAALEMLAKNMSEAKGVLESHGSPKAEPVRSTALRAMEHTAVGFAEACDSSAAKELE